jgi:hypothetical protein
MADKETQQSEVAQEAAPLDLRQEIQDWFYENFHNQAWMQTESFNKLHAAKEDLLARLKV